MAGPSGMQAGGAAQPVVGLSGQLQQQQHAGANITVQPRAGMQVMAATPNGIMITMSHELWAQMYGAGLVAVQQPGVLSTQQSIQQQPQMPPPTQEQQEMLRRFFTPPDTDQEMQSASQVGMPPSMPKAARAPVMIPSTRDPRLAARDPRGPWSVSSRGRSASMSESGRLLTEIRAEYDLSNYPFNSNVTFFIYTYVEVNGVRRLLRVRTIPDQ